MNSKRNLPLGQVEKKHGPYSLAPNVYRCIIEGYNQAF